MWLAIAIIGALAIGTWYLTLRKKGLLQQSRWAWWREYHERNRRYPTPEEVDDWIRERTGTTAP